MGFSDDPLLGLRTLGGGKNQGLKRDNDIQVHMYWVVAAVGLKTRLHMEPLLVPRTLST